MDQVLILLESFSKSGLVSIVDYKNDLVKLTIIYKSKLTKQSIKKICLSLFKNLNIESTADNILTITVKKDHFNTYNMLMYACIEKNLNIVISILGYCKMEDFDSFAYSTIVEYFNSSELFNRVTFEQSDYTSFLHYMIQHGQLLNVNHIIKKLESIKTNILCHAIKTDNNDMIDLILSSGKIEIADFRKDNPLIWGFKCGNEKIINHYLFQWCTGDDVKCEYILDTLTKTPCVMLAKYNNHPQIVAKYGPLIEKIKLEPKIEDGKILNLN